MIRKRKYAYLKFLLPAAFLLLVTIAALGWQAGKSMRPPASKPAAQDKFIKAGPYDPALLDTLQKWSALMDFKNHPGTFSGVLNYHDLDDSTKNTDNLSYVFSKNGNDCYYRYGSQMTINAAGVYLLVDDGNKRAMLGPQKEVQSPGVGNLNAFRTGMTSENYSLKVITAGVVKTIVLANEKHIACKEYRLSRDTISGKITRVYARLAAFGDPYNRAREKIFDLRLTSMSAVSNPGSFLAGVLERHSGRFKLKASYQDYELIRL